jgi:hypothetical protein
MIEKTCLLIDNEDISSEIESIERLGRAKGLKIKCEHFPVGSTIRTDLFNDENHIDIEKVVREYKQKYKHIVFNLIAIDWDLGDITDGVELIRKFEYNNIANYTPKILYSGLLKDEISSRLSKFKDGEIAHSNILIWINTLIKIDIVDFVDRDSSDNRIVDILSKIPESFDLILEDNLRKFGDLKFRNGFPILKDKTFIEIADIISQDVKINNDFKKEIIEQLISYLSDINI